MIRNLCDSVGIFCKQSFSMTQLEAYILVNNVNNRDLFCQKLVRCCTHFLQPGFLREADDVCSEARCTIGGNLSTSWYKPASRNRYSESQGHNATGILKNL